MAKRARSRASGTPACSFNSEYPLAQLVGGRCLPGTPRRRSPRLAAPSPRCAMPSSLASRGRKKSRPSKRKGKGLINYNRDATRRPAEPGCCGLWPCLLLACLLARSWLKGQRIILVRLPPGAAVGATAPRPARARRCDGDVAGAAAHAAAATRKARLDSRSRAYPPARASRIGLWISG